MGRQFNTDCEGPISKNDNAYELTHEFMERGEEFFAKISKYDDLLADIDKMQGYKAGNTLKLILPFLKAYGITESDIRRFSSQNIIIVPNAGMAIKYIADIMPAFIISTSYCPYIEALCELIDFPVDNTFCTELNLDDYPLPPHEEAHIKGLYEEILLLPDIIISDLARSRDDLDNSSLTCAERLDQIFWQEFPQMIAGKMLEGVNPIGGFEKANAIIKSCEVTKNKLSDVIYVGDSITDAEAMRLVSESGGISVSFNGNRYALQTSNIACMSANALILSALAYKFNEGGSEAIKALAQNWDRDRAEFVREIRTIIPEFSADGAILCQIDESNIDMLIPQSEQFRRTVRGESIGRLG